MEHPAKRISPKDRDALLQALRAGVVPRRGLPLIQVGRAGEVDAAIRDVERIVGGGSAFRAVVGEYGSGKSFLMAVIRAIAAEKNLVTLSADFNPDRRIYGSGGQARSLYQELMRNMATRSKPDGGALASVVERFVSSALQTAKSDGRNVDQVIQDRLHTLSEGVGGYDFAQVIEQYWRGHDGGNEQLKNDALRWLRGEFNTKTDARNALGVRTMVEDERIYDQLKLVSQFVTLAGYSGLLITLDELVNLFKIPQAQSRNANYEQILRILNDVLQGSASHFGVVLGGTPESILDTRRGLYSYPALQTRLAENRFAAQHGLADFSGPVIRLANLGPEEVLILLHKLAFVQAAGDVSQVLLPDEGIHAFLEHCNKQVGAAYFQTPRNTIRAFLDLLAVLEQHPHLSWKDLIETVTVESDNEPADDSLPGGDVGADDELASFRLK